MSIENEVFLKKKADIKKLLPYGFMEQNGAYVLEKDLPGTGMQAILRIQEGKIIGKVYDPFAEEEYIAFRLQENLGSFAAKVKDAYVILLEEIREQCFYDVPYIFDQTNRIIDWIEQEYRIVPDHPFAKEESYDVLRNPDNQKWFGLLGEIDGSKLGLEGKIEVLNVKADPQKISELVETEGIYPAYHMNKKSWISIVLNDTVNDETIHDLIRYSKQSVDGTKNHIWLIPANPKYFDLDHAFQVADEIYWKQSANYQIGDIVYMYYGVPFSSIRYRCKITRIDIPTDGDPTGKIRMDKLMRIKKLDKYDDNLIDRKVLRQFGIVTVRGPRNMPQELIDEIERIYKEQTND